MTKRILIINPNTTASITDRVLTAAGTMAPTVEFVGVTGRFGARYIANRATYAIAGHAALDAWAGAPGPFDAVILACFGDPALEALQELSATPVVGMADASVSLAVERPGRFSIVTGGDAWRPMLHEFVVLRALSGRLASIRTVAPTGGAIARAPDEALSLLREACAKCFEDDGAEAVILGGAGLIDLAPKLRPFFNGLIIDSLEAAVAAALRVTAPGNPLAAGRASTDAMQTVGLSQALANMLGGTSAEPMDGCLDRPGDARGQVASSTV